MHRLLGIALLLAACGDAYTPLNELTFDEATLETWGNGIEGFNPNQPSGSVDTGGTDPTGFTDFDGTYFGTYSMSLSIAGSTCSCEGQMSAVVTNGTIEGAGQQCVTDCNRAAELSFTGTVSPDETAAGTVDEVLGFVFTSNWSGFVAGTQLSGTFNEQVPSQFDGLITAYGTFNANR